MEKIYDGLIETLALFVTLLLYQKIPRMADLWLVCIISGVFPRLQTTSKVQ